jgi:hypothetical protein
VAQAYLGNRMNAFLAVATASSLLIQGAAVATASPEDNEFHSGFSGPGAVAAVGEVNAGDTLDATLVATCPSDCWVAFSLLSDRFPTILTLLHVSEENISVSIKSPLASVHYDLYRTMVPTRIEAHLLINFSAFQEIVFAGYLSGVGEIYITSAGADLSFSATLQVTWLTPEDVAGSYIRPVAPEVSIAASRDWYASAFTVVTYFPPEIVGADGNILLLQIATPNETVSCLQSCFDAIAGPAGQYSLSYPLSYSALSVYRLYIAVYASFPF